MQTIKCKVTARGTIRRFDLGEVDYSSLRERIKTLFGYESDVFTIQLKDKKGKLLLVSSDEELRNAAKTETLLRLTIEDEQKETNRRCKKFERDPVDNLARLRKKQKKVTELLDSPDCQKRHRLLKKLAVINAKIEDLLTVKTDSSKEEFQNPVPEEVPSSSLELSAPGSYEIGVPRTLKGALKEASRRYFFLQKDVEQLKLRRKHLKKVLSAVEFLSGASEFGITVDIKQVNQIKSGLDLSYQQLWEKRQLAKAQACVVRNFVHLCCKMDYEKGKLHNYKKKERKDKEKKCRKYKKVKKEKKYKSKAKTYNAYC